MQLLTLTVRAEDVEHALDVLLPRFPEGVHTRAVDGRVELLVYGAPAPDVELLATLDPTLLAPPAVTSASDDWRERRRQRFRPHVYGGRLAVRPAWAEPPPDGVIDVVLGQEAAAFGTGDHPTTRACLELLCQLPPEDSLADLGCGSGVLAIAAARLGWPDVTAVDVDPRSVSAAAANALRNGVDVKTRTLDLVRDALPAATVSLANVPAFVHERLAGRLASRTVVATGIESGHAATVVAAYEAAGYRQVVVEDLFGWTLLVAERAGP